MLYSSTVSSPDFHLHRCRRHCHWRGCRRRDALDFISCSFRTTILSRRPFVRFREESSESKTWQGAMGNMGDTERERERYSDRGMLDRKRERIQEKSRKRGNVSHGLSSLNALTDKPARQRPKLIFENTRDRKEFRRRTVVRPYIKISVCLSVSPDL